MSELTQNRFSGLTAWGSNGPWRSKSVIAAVLLTLLGIWSWVSEIKGSLSIDEVAPAATNAPVAVATDAVVNPPVGEWDWDKPLPGYAKLSASYVVGCCIGWFFRRLTRLILVACALAIALLGVGKFAGLDTSEAQEEVRTGTDWAQRGVKEATESLKLALPSAAGGGVGMFMGFWRRRKVAAAKTE